MKKLIIPFLAVMTLIFTSCEETQSPIYDGFQSLAYFDGTGASLEVEIGSSGQITVPVNISTLSSSDRTVTVSVNEGGTTAASTQYSFNGNVTIPANSYFGSFTLSGIDDSALTTTGSNLSLSITSVEGGGVASAANYDVRILLICPIDPATFVGDYQIQFITPGVFGLGAFGNDGSIVTLEAGSSSTARMFDSFYLGDGRFPQTFDFELSCNQVRFAELDTNVTCVQNDGINLVLGPPSAGNEGVYDPNDDSSFTLNITDNVQSDCGGVPSQSSYRFVKQ